METRDEWYKPNLLYNIHYRPPKKPEPPKMIVETVRFSPSVCTCGQHDCEPRYRMEKRVLWTDKEVVTNKEKPQKEVKEKMIGDDDCKVILSIKRKVDNNNMDSDNAHGDEQIMYKNKENGYFVDGGYGDVNDCNGSDNVVNGTDCNGGDGDDESDEDVGDGDDHEGVDDGRNGGGDVVNDDGGDETVDNDDEGDGCGVHEYGCVADIADGDGGGDRKDGESDDRDVSDDGDKRDKYDERDNCRSDDDGGFNDECNGADGDEGGIGIGETRVDESDVCIKRKKCSVDTADCGYCIEHDDRFDVGINCSRICRGENKSTIEDDGSSNQYSGNGVDESGGETGCADERNEPCSNESVSENPVEEEAAIGNNDVRNPPQEAAEISCAFGILSVYCNSELHSWYREADAYNSD